MVIRRFIPSKETQKLSDVFYLSIDSNVFVADEGNPRVILGNWDLMLYRILFPTKEEKEEHILKEIFYDEKMKQLIGARCFVVRNIVNVHTLSLN